MCNKYERHNSLNLVSQQLKLCNILFSEWRTSAFLHTPECYVIIIGLITFKPQEQRMKPVRTQVPYPKHFERTKFLSKISSSNIKVDTNKETLLRKQKCVEDAKNVFEKFQKHFFAFKTQILCLQHMLHAGANEESLGKH